MASASRNDDVTHYLSAARNAPELDREEEAELCRRWQKSRDRPAADRLARSHMRQVIVTALKYRRYGVPVGELVAEGNVGIVHALEKFEPGRGVRFGTYASYWVRAQMLAYVVKSHSAVGGSDGPLRSQVFFKLRRERVRAANLFGAGEAAERELAERLGVTVERTRAMVQRLDSRDVSMDASAGGETVNLVDRIPAPDDQEQELGAAQMRVRLSRALQQAVASLDPRERYIVENGIMAEGGDALTLAEMARQLSVSRERVRQLEVRAKIKLRRSIVTDTDPAIKEWLALEAPPPPRVPRRRTPRRRRAPRVSAA